MGTFKEKITLINPENQQLKTEVDCVVDTGATYTWIPAEILMKIELKDKFKRKFKIADGTIIERDMTEALVSLKGESHHSYCLWR